MVETRSQTLRKTIVPDTEDDVDSRFEALEKAFTIQSK